ncbi:MAG TPA: dUTP diphosphatase [Candidatus Saccharimonadales bacterium]|nr:dUTP diphosphatase [Candidatus Saccharimonadales bacterium]
MIKVPELSEKPTLGELQFHLQKVCELRGWDKHSISEVFLLFSEEIGELAKDIRKFTGFKGEKPTDSTDQLSSELADVLNYLMEIANRFGVDLETAYRQKQATNASREWK